MNFWEIIFLFFAFQAFFLAFLFFLKKGDKIANLLLGIYILLFGYNIMYNVLYWSGKLYTQEFIPLIFTNYITWVSYGPILYLYIRRVVKRDNFKIFDLIHFVPILYIVINFSKLFFLNSEAKINALKSGNWISYIINPSFHTIKIVILIMLVYFILIVFLLKNNLQSRNKIRWLNWLSFSYLGYVVSFTAYFVLRYFGFIAIGYDYFIGFSMVFFVGLVSYFGFLQPKIFEGLSMDKVLPFKKYEKTGLTKNHSAELKLRLLSLMDNSKPFLDSELRLDHLAEKLNLSRHHMSQVINEHFDASFFDFVNKYRVEEAKSMLIDDDNLTVTDVLYASGFNNRVSFYKAFKKFTGNTPSQYKLKEGRAS